MATVYKLDPLQDPRWPNLVNRHPDASVFHTTGWLEALRQTYGYKPVVFTTSAPNEELHNGLLFCQIRSWLTGPRMVSLPFTDHCEPLVNSPEELDFLVGCLQADMDHQDWEYMEVRPINGSFNRKGETAGFRTSRLYYLHQLDLRPALDDIFRDLHKDSTQRRIRRAERAGVVCDCGRSGKHLEVFYHLQVRTRSRHHLPPQPFVWFQNLVQCLGDALEIRLAYKDGTPIAAILTLRFRDTVYYKYGCSDAKFKYLGATPLLLWRTIQDAKAAGAQKFDLGRSESENQGLIVFKDHWTHGHTRLMYWRYPAPDTLAVREGWKLNMAKRVFAFMPDKLLTVTGRLIYRHIG